MKKLTLVLMVVGLGLLLSASAFAFGGPRDDRGPMDIAYGKAGFDRD